MGVIPTILPILLNAAAAARVDLKVLKMGLEFRPFQRRWQSQALAAASNIFAGYGMSDDRPPCCGFHVRSKDPHRVIRLGSRIPAPGPAWQGRWWICASRPSGMIRAARLQVSRPRSFCVRLGSPRLLRQSTKPRSSFGREATHTSDSAVVSPMAMSTSPTVSRTCQYRRRRVGLVAADRGPDLAMRRRCGGRRSSALRDTNGASGRVRACQSAPGTHEFDDAATMTISQCSPTRVISKYGLPRRFLFHRGIPRRVRQDQHEGARDDTGKVRRECSRE